MIPHRTETCTIFQQDWGFAFSECDTVGRSRQIFAIICCIWTLHFASLLSLFKQTPTLLLVMETQSVDTTETNAARVRLMALLALYDCLPPSIDGIVIPDFNPPPSFDSVNDANSILHSLDAISQKLHIQGLDSFRTSLFAASRSISNTVCIFLYYTLAPCNFPDNIQTVQLIRSRTHPSKCHWSWDSLFNTGISSVIAGRNTVRVSSVITAVLVCPFIFLNSFFMFHGGYRPFPFVHF